MMTDGLAGTHMVPVVRSNCALARTGGRAEEMTDAAVAPASARRERTDTVDGSCIINGGS